MLFALYLCYGCMHYHLRVIIMGSIITSSSFFPFFFFLKTSSYCEAHTGLEFMTLLPQLPRVGILAYAALCYHELLPCVFLKAGHSLHSSAQAVAQCCQQPTGWLACAICPRALWGHRIQCRAVLCTLISNRSTFFCFPTLHDFDICGKYTAVAAECLTVGPLAFLCV